MGAALEVEQPVLKLLPIWITGTRCRSLAYCNMTLTPVCHILNLDYVDIYSLHMQVKIFFILKVRCILSIVFSVSFEVITVFSVLFVNMICNIYGFAFADTLLW